MSEPRRLTTIEGAALSAVLGAVSYLTATIMDNKQANIAAKEVAVQRQADDARYNAQLSEFRAALMHARDREIDCTQKLAQKVR